MGLSSIAQPLTWDDVQRYINIGTVESLAKLGRSEQQKAEYGQYIAKVKEEYAQIGDYLKMKIFNASTYKNDDGKLVACDINLPQGLNHYNLWSTEPLTEQELHAFVQAKVGVDTPYAHFVNPPVLQSAPQIWHAHVIVNEGPGKK